MKTDIDALAVLIRKMEEELMNVVELLAKKDGILKDSDTVFLLIFRKIIEKIDAVFVLYDNGHERSSESIARDIFENYLYFAYINKGNYEYKTKAYQFENLKNQLMLFDWFDIKSPKGKRLKHFFGTDKFGPPKEFKKRKEYIIGRLKKDEFRNINLDWDRKLREFRKRKPGSVHPKWYNIGNGVKNVSQLSKFLGMSEDYETIYALFSHQVHSLNALTQIERIDENLGALIPIRDDVTKGLSLQVSYTLGILSLKIIFERFFQDGHSSFVTWYRKELKKEILKEKENK